MKRLLAIVLALASVLMLAVPVFALEELPVKTTVTVVGCRVLDGGYELALSFRELHYSASEGCYVWYYTTSNVGFYPDPESEAADGTSPNAYGYDGSDEGKVILDKLTNNEPIPVGTVIKLEWSGMILEVYPPILSGITGYTFTDKTTDYSYDEIIGQLNEMNEMRSDDNKYPVPEKSEVRCAESAEATVAYCDTSNAVDGEHGKTGSEIFVVMQVGSSKELISLNANFDKISFVSNRSDEDAARLYDKFLETGELPIGTVLNVVWSGMVLDSYPSQLEGVFEIEVTSKKSDIADAELAEKMNAYFKEFDINNVIAINEEEPKKLPENSQNNPSTGITDISACTALAGVLAWVGAVVSNKKK